MAGKADLVNGIVDSVATSQIVGGAAAQPGEFPWQLSQGSSVAAHDGTLSLDPFG